MGDLGAWIERTFGISSSAVGQIGATVTVIVALVVLRLVALQVVDRRVKNPQYRYQWRKSSLYIAVVLGVLVVTRVWFEGFRSILTFLGLLSAGLAVALGDVVLDLAAWVFIMTRRPFRVGDRVQIGGHAGDVVDMRLFQFLIMEIGNWVEADQYTGRLIYIPNGRVFREPLVNYSITFHHIWNEIPVVVTFESNWKKAKQILLEIASHYSEAAVEPARRQLKQAARKLFLSSFKMEPSVYTSAKDYGVLLTIRYLCEPKGRRDSVQSIWEEILQRFAEEDDIEFAYHTQRIFYNPAEGKPGAIPNQDMSRLDLEGLPQGVLDRR